MTAEQLVMDMPSLMETVIALVSSPSTDMAPPNCDMARRTRLSGLKR